MGTLDAECPCVIGMSSCDYEAPQPLYPVTNEEKWIAIAYATCVFVVCAFAIYAVIRFTLYQRQRGRGDSTDEFLTARGTQGPWRITYSFFAAVVGAWCIASPASFAVNTGILGLAMYAVSSGFPVLVLAYCGAHIVNKHKGVVNISDFADRRFGPTFKVIVTLICLFNMGIAMVSEYTTVGSLFSDFVGSYAWPMIITVGILTMAYTVYGGLYISIVTDQVQAIATILFIAILTIYVAVTFRAPLPKPLPNDVNYFYDPVTGYQNYPLGVNKWGYSSIFSMPVALMASTVFSEAVWQKVWASESRRSLLFGGWVSFILITIAVFLFGFGGWLAAWAGFVSSNTNPNLYLFQVFKSEQGTYMAPDYPPLSPFAPPDAPLSPGSLSPPDAPFFAPPDYPPDSPPAPPLIYNPISARLNSWVGVIVLMLAVTMNEGLIDSLQNGMTSLCAHTWFPNQNILFARLIVIVLNVPIMIVGTQKYTILQLYLIANMLTTCWFLPVLAGLWDWTTDVVGETGAIFGGSVSILTTIAYSSGITWNKTDDHLLAIQYAWYGAFTYDWDQFMVASGASVGGMILWAVPKYLLKRYWGIEGPGISKVLSHVPGFKYMTGSGFDFDLMTAIGLGRFNTPTNGGQQYSAEGGEHAEGGAVGKTLEGSSSESGQWDGKDGKAGDADKEPDPGVQLSSAKELGLKE